MLGPLIGQKGSRQSFFFFCGPFVGFIGPIMRHSELRAGPGQPLKVDVGPIVGLMWDYLGAIMLGSCGVYLKRGEKKHSMQKNKFKTINYLIVML